MCIDQLVLDFRGRCSSLHVDANRKITFEWWERNGKVRREGGHCLKVNIKNWFETAVLITRYIRKSAIAVACSEIVKIARMLLKFCKEESVSYVMSWIYFLCHLKIYFYHLYNIIIFFFLLSMKQLSLFIIYRSIEYLKKLINGFINIYHYI